MSFVADVTDGEGIGPVFQLQCIVTIQIGDGACTVPLTCTVAPVSGSLVCRSVIVPLMVPAVAAMTESVRNKIRKKIFPKSNFMLISFLCTFFLIRCKDEAMTLHR